MTSPDTIIHAQLELSHCTAEISLNGIPTTRIAWSPTRIPIENVAADHLLIPGANRLELMVEPGSTPSLARSEKRELPFQKMSAVARLIRFRDGATGLVEDGELLCEVAFRWQDASLEKQIFPQGASREVDLGPAHGRWAWQDAPALVLDAALIAEARAVLDELEAALRSFHADRFWALTELQIKDVLRAYPAVTEAYLRSDLAAMFDHYRDKPEPVMRRDPADHDFRLVAGDRIVECIDKDWSTSFKLRDPGDDSPVPFRVMLARIDGKLRIVR